MDCAYCQGCCIKKGLQRGVQKWLCKVCRRWQLGFYRNNKVTEEKVLSIIDHNNEANSISSIARLVRLSKATVQRVICKYGSSLRKPEVSERDEEYEMDELCTYIGKKKSLVWITYAINKWTRQVIDLVVGPRDADTVGKVVGSVLLLNPARIYTDRFNVYPNLIPEVIHRTKKYKTNHIERKNLDLRNSLKRLSRKTICYSKSAGMLEACVKLYVWNQPPEH